MAAYLCGELSVAPVHLPDPEIDELLEDERALKSIVLAGGCFWGMELVFRHVAGVVHVVAGYAGGNPITARYESVKIGTTEHAECVQVTYDASRITLGKILKVFFSVAHDPTQLNRQGPDVGKQYRSVIFYASGDQKRIAKAYIDQLERARAFPRPIRTKLDPLQGFYMAEDYHQNYAQNNPHGVYIVTHDLPKIAALKAEFPELYVQSL